MMLETISACPLVFGRSTAGGATPTNGTEDTDQFASPGYPTAGVERSL